MRIYLDIYEATNELLRDLIVRGSKVQIASMQNKKGSYETQELIAESFMITNPLRNREEAFKLLYKDDNRPLLYAIQESQDRLSGKATNPGQSYLLRLDTWKKFLREDGLMDYTYSERYNKNEQINTVIATLVNDIGTRQAVLSVFWPSIDMTLSATGGKKRIPCSLNYQFLIRDNKLYCIYSMRSNDLFTHFLIDIYTTTELMLHVLKEVNKKYPNIELGGLIYQCGSLHAYKEDIDKLKEVVF